MVGSHEIEKALEVWTLQNLLNLSILIGLLSLGLALVQKYYRAIEKHLTLRVSIEILKVVTIVLVDILIAIVVLVGYVVLNPDIMADIKMAVPFVPIAIVLFAAALVIRLFYKGHDENEPNFMKALWLLFVANILNIIGFSLVMEAPSSEYLSIHPSTFWTFVKTHLRSNAIPHGLELAQISFYICFVLLLCIFIWAFATAIKTIKARNDK